MLCACIGCESDERYRQDCYTRKYNFRLSLSRKLVMQRSRVLWGDLRCDQTVAERLDDLAVTADVGTSDSLLLNSGSSIEMNSLSSTSCLGSAVSTAEMLTACVPLPLGCFSKETACPAFNVL